MEQLTDFGGQLRGRRKAEGVGLRELARRVNVSPAYLSKIETGQFRPPAEGKLIAIAKQLNLDSDALLAQAGRVATDVLDIIKTRPVEMTKLIRAAGQLMESPSDAL
jgi:transcriptional regulator with XRE-family HTH domain